MVRETTDKRLVHEKMRAFGISSIMYDQELYYDELDKLEFALSHLPPAHCPVSETLTDGMYGRLCEIPARPTGDTNVIGCIIVSRIHRQNHQYVILKGAGQVFEVTPTGCRWFEYDTRIHGPLLGVTQPHTKRILLVTEDTAWKTFHPNPENLSADDLLAQIIEPRQNPLFTLEQQAKRRKDAENNNSQLTDENQIEHK